MGDTEIQGDAQQFADEVNAVIERHRLENALSYAEMMGILETAKLDLWREAGEDDDDPV